MNEVLTIIKNRAVVRLSMTDIFLCLWYVYVVASALTSTGYPCYHTVSGATYMLSLHGITYKGQVFDVGNHYVVDV